MSAEYTTKSALEQLNPNNAPDALRKLHLGLREEGVKVTVTASAQVPTGRTGTIESPLVTVALAVATFNPPIAAIKALRVTAGAAAGGRLILDAAGTPTTTAATISDDGSTLTFEATVTGLVISYIPRLSTAELAAKFYPLT